MFTHAAFLQNAPVVRRTRGFTPGWYTVPRWGTPNASPAPSFLSERRTDPAEPPKRQAERDRSAASIEGDHQSPSRKARKPHPPPSLPASVGPIPRSTPYAQRSGIGPQRALEANTKIPRAQRESPILPRASSASAGPIPRSAPPTRTAEVPSRPRLGTVWGMRRSFRTLRLCAVPGVSPRAGIRCPVGALRTPHLPRASSASAGPIPRSTPYAQRSGIGPQRALEANTKNPSRNARKPHPPPSLPASEGPIPRSISTLAQEQRQPLTPRAPCQIGASL
jgi:hypothetical protein